ncbi:hypothetical protein AB6A40_001987 [Gnathostoma spinigerum]|uniref:PRORP domain-containing protein n=1 Tax=Gnathostoma spinigerum TaxID=75299 RepID=A0ABD6E5H8_9BILA
MLLALKEQFPLILFITRFGLQKSFINYLDRIGVSIFQCDKRSNDDWFSILAALEVGRDCYLLTNDLFHDHRVTLKSVQSLFDIWTRSRTIRFSRITRKFMMPYKYSTLPHRTKKGYHMPIAVQREASIFVYRNVCLEPPVILSMTLSRIIRCMCLVVRCIKLYLHS